jgi:hypothetical protein
VGVPQLRPGGKSLQERSLSWVKPIGGHGPLVAHCQAPEAPQMQPTVPCPVPREHVQVDGGATQGSPQVGWTAGHAAGGTAGIQAWCPVASQPHVHEGTSYGLAQGRLHAPPEVQVGCGHVAALVA